MRTLVLIAADHYVRNFVTTGAFDALDPNETFYVASERGVAHPEMRAKLEALPGYLGTVDDPREQTKWPYRIVRQALLAALRRKSRTMATKFSLLPRRQRIEYRIAALPGIRTLLVKAVMRRTGRNPQLDELMERVKPELVLAPSGGYDSLVWDGMRSAKAFGIRTALLIHNWDNLSSKGAFAVRPDHLAVWGEQSAEHAERIHGFKRDQVRVLGVPTFDHYFRHVPGSTESPFPFRYVLFAGCYAPFDELTALQALERTIDERGLDLKVVYRPHPHRRPRRRSDFFDETKFEHVVLDPQMRELYMRAFAEEYGPKAKRLKPLFPALDYYPALFENSEFVICPLSTMLVEAAIFEKRVLAIAYDDGIHPDSPATVVHYDHFEGIDRVDGFEMIRRAEDLAPTFARYATTRERPAKPLRDQISWWLFHDERTYAERLGEYVDDLGRQMGKARPASEQPTPVS